MSAPLHDDEEMSEGSLESCRHVGDQRVDHEVNATDEGAMNHLSNANQENQPRPNLPDLNAAASEEDMGFDCMAVIPYYGCPVSLIPMGSNDNHLGVPAMQIDDRLMHYNDIFTTTQQELTLFGVNIKNQPLTDPCLETRIHDEVAGVPHSSSGISQCVLESGVIDIL
ncbi:hypothetical protein TB2_034416 [Malus domestica]